MLRAPLSTALRPRQARAGDIFELAGAARSVAIDSRLRQSYDDANKSHLKGLRVASSDSSLTIYIEHRDELLNYAYRYLQDRAIAEDVVQEAWLRLAARSDHGEEIRNTLSYLYSIVRNLALDWVRRGPREVSEAPDSTALVERPSEAPSAEHVVVHRDEVRALIEAVAELSPRVQLAFRMYKLEERSLQEVADRLGLSVSRAHQMVREALLHGTRRLYGDEDES